MRAIGLWVWSAPRSVVILAAIIVEVALLAIDQNLQTPFGFWLLHLLPVAAVSYRGALSDGFLAAVLVVLLGSSGVSYEPLLSGGLDLSVRLGFAIGFAVLVHRLGEVDGVEGSFTSPGRSPGTVDRRTFFSQVAAEVDRAKRYERQFTLVYLRVDNLPVHRAALVSRSAAEALYRVLYHLRGSLRGTDTVAQVRPREFALLLPETDVEAARIVLRRIRRILVVATGEEADGLLLSLGATTWVNGSLSAEELHQQTYQLMYTALQEHSVLRHQIVNERISEPSPDRQLVLSR
jgi:diguanylate cyclase (GGDEF)-like protein